MLLKSLIDQLKADEGTPGTPCKNGGVPDLDPLELAPTNNLIEAEHQEHQEHQKRSELNSLSDCSLLQAGIGCHALAEDRCSQEPATCNIANGMRRYIEEHFLRKAGAACQ